MTQSSTTGTGAAQLVDALEHLGVSVVFGLPGVHNLAIWDELSRSQIRTLGVRHEQAAAYAADGYARVTGEVGVALVTTGPGAANAVTGVGEAFASGSPVLLVATDIPAKLRKPGINRGVLHETADQASMFATVTKRASTVASAVAISTDLVEAHLLAARAPAAPVYLGVPTDFLAEGTERSGSPPEPRVDAALSPPEAALERASGLLAGAERTLIVVGGGAVHAAAGDAVGKLAEALAAPVVTTYAAKGLIPPSHPCSVSWTLHAPPVGALWDEADVVLAIGTDLDGMTTQNWAMPAPRSLICINVSEGDAAKNYDPELTIVGDARDVVERLSKRIPARSESRPTRPWAAMLEEQVRQLVVEDDPQALALLDAFAELVPADVAVVADMCVAGYWLGGFHSSPGPRRFLYPVGWGTLGFGFPAAIGASLAAGVERSVCVCGDGGFLFACGELATLAQERLPVTVVLVDDSGYGMLRFDQTNAGQEPFGVELNSPDFVAMAKSFGVEASRVDDFGDGFRSRFATYLRAKGPNLLVVRQRLRPPVNTSPRWYRRRSATTDRRPEGA